MCFDWEPKSYDIAPFQLKGVNMIDRETILVRDIVIDWFNERFFPDKPNLTVIDKCILLFDKSCLREIAEDYYKKMVSGEKHWIEYLFSILEEFRFNFGEDELKDALNVCGIEPSEFVDRLARVSGFVEDVGYDFKSNKIIDDIPKYLGHKIEKLGNYYGFIYTCETDYIMAEIGSKIKNFDKNTLRLKIIEILDSKKIPSLYEDRLMFDRCSEEDDEKYFDFKDTEFNPRK